MYHWSDISITNIIIMKKFEILQELPKCGIRDMKWANAVGKIVHVDLLNTGLPQTFNSWKMVSKKHSKLKYWRNKMRFACRYACIYKCVLICLYICIYWYLYLLWVFPGGSVVESLPANTVDTDLIPGQGRSPGKGNDNPFQYSCLRNPMDRGAWQATVHGVACRRVIT